jgi:hypothetical protein
MSDKKTIAMTKAELRQMLAEAVRNTQPQSIGTPELPRQRQPELKQTPKSLPKPAKKRNAPRASAL